MSFVSLSRWSDAAVRLWQACDVGKLLGRLLREELEQRPGRDAPQYADPAQGRGLALRGEVVAQEVDRLPVLVGQVDANLGGEGLCQRLGPLRRVGHEPFVVDVDRLAVDGCGG